VMRRRKRGYFDFRSRLRRLTMSEAVRFNSLEPEPLGGRYADHKTRCDLGSTRKIVPLPRPNEGLALRSANLLAGVKSRVEAAGLDSLLADESSFLDSSVFAETGGFAVSGAAVRPASLSSNACPIRSVKMASACFGSVTTWKIWSCVSQFARYWSIPWGIGSRYTEWTDATSCPNASTPAPHNNSKTRFIDPMIPAAPRLPALALRWG